MEVISETKGFGQGFVGVIILAGFLPTFFPMNNTANNPISRGMMGLLGLLLPGEVFCSSLLPEAEIVFGAVSLQVEVQATSSQSLVKSLFSNT